MNTIQLRLNRACLSPRRAPGTRRALRLRRRRRQRELAPASSRRKTPPRSRAQPTASCRWSPPSKTPSAETQNSCGYRRRCSQLTENPQECHELTLRQPLIQLGRQSGRRPIRCCHIDAATLAASFVSNVDVNFQRVLVLDQQTHHLVIVVDPVNRIRQDLLQHAGIHDFAQGHVLDA